MSAHVTPWSTPRSRPLRVVVEAAWTAAGVLAYFGIRHLTRSDPGAAMRHASWIRSAEQHLGIHREAWLQRRVVPHPVAVSFFDDVYIYGHWPLIAAALGWLLWRHPAEFRVARNAMIISGGIALIVFACFPVAPPRLADPSIVDTVTLHMDAYRVLQPPAFTDAYAAMPSLHCGWDLVMALSVGRVVGKGWTKRAVYVLPGLMVGAVLVTGNHYIVDAIAGDLLALSAVAVARRIRPAPTT